MTDIRYFLHLLEDKEKAMADIYAMLKPGGIFVTSTVCIAEMASIFKHLLPLGSAIGLLPIIKIFTSADLEKSMKAAGFKLDHVWRPSEKGTIFIVAKK